MYYVWQSDATLSKTYLYVRDTPEGLMNEDWSTGKPLSKKPEPITFMGASNRPTKLSDVLLGSFNLPVLSPKAISIFEQIGIKNIEYFPVSIKHPKLKTPEDSYKIANIIGLVNCLDKKHATLNTFEDGEISWLQQFRIVESKIKKSSLLFRLGEFPGHILAHESIKNGFEKAGLTGSKFIPPEKFA